jgi:hypothetical protein
MRYGRLTSAGAAPTKRRHRSLNQSKSNRAAKKRRMSFEEKRGGEINSDVFPSGYPTMWERILEFSNGHEWFILIMAFFLFCV